MVHMPFDTFRKYSFKQLQVEGTRKCDVHVSAEEATVKTKACHETD